MAGNNFCIEINESYIRVGDVKKEGQLFATDHLGAVETLPAFLPGDSEKVIEEQAGYVYNLLNQIGLKKKTVGIVVPDSYTFSQITSMPKLNEKEMLSAIKFQADQFIPMPLDEINLDIELLHENVQNKSMLTLIAAAPKKLIEKIEKLLDLVGLEAETVETEISAIGRVASEIIKQDPTSQDAISKGVLFVNFGFSSTSLYFFDQKLGIFTYSHNFNIGYNLFVKEIQVNLNIDPKKSIELLKGFGLAQTASFRLDTILAPGIKDFSSELQRFLNELHEKYHGQVTEVLVFNESDRFHSFEQIIGKQMGTQARLLDLYPFFVKNNVVESFKPMLGSFAAVVGGSLR